MAKYTCKSCGVPLEVEDGELTVECPFCKAELTVEELKSDGKTDGTEEVTEAVEKVAAEEDDAATHTAKKKTPFFGNKKKRVLCFILAAALLIGLVVGFQVCSAPPPHVEEIYDRVVELVESANRFNTLLYGKGLPTYAEDSEYAEINHLYFRGNGVPGGYLVVSDYTMFTSIDQIKAEAETIYSKEWLDSVMYPTLFDGYVSEDGSVARARYEEANEWIYMSENAADDYLKDSGMRLYDYSTMEIIEPSNNERVVVQMDSWLSSTPSVVNPATVTLVLQDGQWFLHSFTG
ncbi:MAG: hypothetical protein IJW49_05955 [Clostridia bacterium]|nr:hypothetical protein [Clostridia bacterium]